MRLLALTVVPTTTERVEGVLPRISDVKMIGSDTRRVVTVVESQLLRAEGRSLQLKREPVCSPVAAPSPCSDAVALAVPGTCPRPAAIRRGAVNAAPEVLAQGALRGSITGIGTVRRAPSGGGARLNHKGLAALGADPRNTRRILSGHRTHLRCQGRAVSAVPSHFAALNYTRYQIGGG
jgi:hypothetical protein